MTVKTGIKKKRLTWAGRGWRRWVSCCGLWAQSTGSPLRTGCGGYVWTGLKETNIQICYPQAPNCSLTYYFHGYCHYTYNFAWKQSATKEIPTLLNIKLLLCITYNQTTMLFLRKWKIRIIYLRFCRLQVIFWIRFVDWIWSLDKKVCQACLGPAIPLVSVVYQG